MDFRAGFYVILLAVLAGVSALLVLPLLQYLLAAAFLAFVLFPVHERLSTTRVETRWGGVTVGSKASAGILTVFAIVAAILPLLFFTVVIFQTVLSFTRNFEELELVATVQELTARLSIEDEMLELLRTQLLEEIEGLLESSIQIFFQELLSLVDLSIRVGIGLLVFVFLLYYFLIDGRRLLVWIATVTPLEEEVRTELFEEISVVTWAVMKSHVFVAVIEGILGGIGLYLLGVPNAVFWTVVMIVVSFLPAIGIWLVWAPAVGYLALAGAPLQAGVLLVYGIAVLSVVDNYLRAILVDRGSGVHPAVVLVGVIGGIYLFGILGLFLGPVVLAVLKAGLQVFGDVYVTDGQTAEIE